jgi:hypothetical protein
VENPNEALTFYSARGSAIFDMEDATFEILLSKLKDEGGTLASHLVGRDIEDLRKDKKMPLKNHLRN